MRTLVKPLFHRLLVCVVQASLAFPFLATCSRWAGVICIFFFTSLLLFIQSPYGFVFQILCLLLCTGFIFAILFSFLFIRRLAGRAYISNNLGEAYVANHTDVPKRWVIVAISRFFSAFPVEIGECAVGEKDRENYQKNTGEIDQNTEKQLDIVDKCLEKGKEVGEKSGLNSQDQAVIDKDAELIANALREKSVESGIRNKEEMGSQLANPGPGRLEKALDHVVDVFKGNNIQFGGGNLHNHYYSPGEGPSQRLDQSHLDSNALGTTEGDVFPEARLEAAPDPDGGNRATSPRPEPGEKESFDFKEDSTIPEWESLDSKKDKDGSHPGSPPSPGFLSVPAPIAIPNRDLPLPAPKEIPGPMEIVHELFWSIKQKFDFFVDHYIELVEVSTDKWFSSSQK